MGDRRHRSCDFSSKTSLCTTNVNDRPSSRRTRIITDLFDERAHFGTHEALLTALRIRFNVFARLKTLTSYQRSLGITTGYRWYRLRLLNHQGRVKDPAVEIHPAFLQHPVGIRMQSSSDAEVFDGVFVQRQLGFAHLLDRPPKVIFDLGANVGYASAFFLNTWPGSFILAVEPDPLNFERCRMNLGHYGSRVRMLQGAAWHCNKELVLSRGTFGDGREHATEVRDPAAWESSDVRAWDMPSLMKFSEATNIDLLKIDIEGSEKALFSAGADRWLDRVRNICIELHGPKCEAVFWAALREYDYEQSRWGEHILCLNVRRKSS
jgi:FkbM family methyltransferase